jgi:hypothetical protein
MEQDNLTAKQQDYAVFLPAISGFYATFIGKQRNENYVDPARFPQGLTDMEQLNWLNAQQALFPYKWSLYSGGHANLDLTKPDSSEDMVRKRDPATVMLGDSGGFQIAKGLWEGDWRAGSGCARAQARREAVLKWLDGVADYGMTLDIPTWVINNRVANSKIGNFKDINELVDATRYNNDFYIKHRRGVKNGGMRVLNVLQGATHKDAEQWYQTMKHYCDPVQYPDTHFNGWSMGGQNMCDVELVLKRLVALKYDNLLQEGVHDWMHFLGTSKLEWAVLLTVIQRSVRKHINPNFTISFDCASPFLATANGQVYYENVFPPEGKWSYKMAPVLDDKKYARDTRKWGVGLLADITLKDPNSPIKNWQDSPISNMLKMKDICIYAPGDVNKNGKEGKTSWDSFSYALLMGHNVWMHLTAVQEANRRFDAGEHPAMMQYTGDNAYFEDIVERIFSAPTQQESLEIIAYYSKYWMEIVGTRGNKGKKAMNSQTMAAELVDIEGNLARDKPVKTVQPQPVLNPDLFGE